MRSALVVVLLVLAAALAACGDSEVNRGDPNLFSLDDEWQLGDELHAEIQRQADLVDDPVVAGYVDDIGQDLAAETELADRTWRFHVVRDPSVNAFAVPGGRIYLHTGLLEAVRSEEELAGVLAHEVSHVEARHSTEMMTRIYGINALMGLLTDGEGELERIATDLLGGGAVAKFSRDAEREADRIGIQRLADAGRDPGGMAGFFEVLLAQRERQPGTVEQFFATHPLTEERLERARELSQGLEPSAPVDDPDGDRLAEAQERLGSS